ncbi:DRAP deaminase [Ophidiomyces ophidiicola]|uniref:DRAP deaminase n=1 Tax=Ophidiomyces ophidiicola TaxID=1387563 RepID=UPI0020C50887|nr:DRAP deaminase [Ophidiomyces ophidiicola]KAI1950928.1 DRAP deaminase [Ophidiomyces ophidiicola]KAI2057753.1 DRAP deaminase [Ophidiomyces ophidiicola]
MALALVDSASDQEGQKEAIQPSQTAAIAPCDPWPKPYYLEKGFRRVAPYHYTYNTYCKERWRGRALFDIFATEFRDRPKEYYKEAIESGNVTINGEAASLDTKVKNGDIISHTLHRHEPPVTSLPVGVIHEDDDMIVIDKPAGVPVHPAGRYNYNSVVEIMRAERGHGFNPLPCNRLDRLTSGVMFIGKHPKAAERISEGLRARTMQKEYIARVKGKFPDGIILCDQPMLKISPQLGLNRVRASGKDARSKFRRLAYYPPSVIHRHTSVENEPATPPATLADDIPVDLSDINEKQNSGTLPSSDDEGYSIVHCLPLTGRTHQLRVHLQFLGHPITNDPIYSNRRVFGRNLGKADSTGEHDKEIISRLSKMGKTETSQTVGDFRFNYETFQTPPPKHMTNGGDSGVINDLLAREHDKMVSDYLKRKGEKMSGEQCEVCGTDLYSDPGVHELGIFLHAVSYADLSGDWKYRSKMPKWGMPPEGMDGPTSVPEWCEDGEDIIVGQGRAEGETALVEGVGTISIPEMLSGDRISAEDVSAAAVA